MTEREKADDLILEVLSRVKGIERATPFADEDRRKVIDLEHEAEAKSLLGLGKVINTGIRKVAECDWIYVGLTNMDFDWGRRSNLVMKKGDAIVGEEVTDKETISRLSGDKNVWFMHKNFVVYKDKVSFPQDVMKKICYFEIPSHPADWCNVESGELEYHSIVYGSPSTPCDIFLKNRYFQGADVKGFGTILIGVRL
jgi:hypothetical protein